MAHQRRYRWASAIFESTFVALLSILEHLHLHLRDNKISSAESSTSVKHYALSLVDGGYLNILISDTNG